MHSMPPGSFVLEVRPAPSLSRELIGPIERPWAQQRPLRSTGSDKDRRFESGGSGVDIEQAGFRVGGSQRQVEGSLCTWRVPLNVWRGNVFGSLGGVVRLQQTGRETVMEKIDGLQGEGTIRGTKCTQKL